MKEQWKVIEGYPNYEVSSLGRVRNIKTGRVLRLGITNKGYQQVGLYLNGKNKFQLIHRLVASAFIPNPECMSNINHINGIKTDNRVENLEWVTVSENIKHAYKTGLNTRIQPCRCVETGQEFESLTQASIYFGCGQWSIESSITKGYKVLKKYHFELT